MAGSVIHWFRGCLRLHDNPALIDAVMVGSRSGKVVRPVYILDPWYKKQNKICKYRYRFLLEALHDLDASLRKLGSRLFVFQGNPKDVFQKYFAEWETNFITWESDIEPYAMKRDDEIYQLASVMNIGVSTHTTHKLYEADVIINKNNGEVILIYQDFFNLILSLDPPSVPDPALTILPTVCMLSTNEMLSSAHGIPTVNDIIGENDYSTLCPVTHPGGETEGLRRLDEELCTGNKRCFYTEPSPTDLDVYVTFGCVSARQMYWKIKGTYDDELLAQCPPPLYTKLLSREFYYCIASVTENFDQMKDNRICRQITWDNDPLKTEAWRGGCTGYPFIDAAMTQLKKEGWIHPQCRNVVGCFLTRRNLWQLWEEGKGVFEEYLLDCDWAVNAGSWMQLSASAFSYDYHQSYSPVDYGKIMDPTGEYVRRFLPQLGGFLPEYVYQPWEAPLSVQEAAGCVIGKDYPKPIVNNFKSLNENMRKMRETYTKKFTRNNTKKRKIGATSEIESAAKMRKRSCSDLPVVPCNIKFEFPTEESDIPVVEGNDCCKDSVIHTSENESAAKTRNKSCSDLPVVPCNIKLEIPTEESDIPVVEGNDCCKGSVIHTSEIESVEKMRKKSCSDLPVLPCNIKLEILTEESDIPVVEGNDCCKGSVIHWFRKGLRIHDNPALIEALTVARANGKTLRPVYVFDPWYKENRKNCFHRNRFIIESLRDLDNSLRKLGLRLFVFRGNPKDVLKEIFEKWKTSFITWEEDLDPYSTRRDEEIRKLAVSMSVVSSTQGSHKLYDADYLIKENSGEAPLVYQSFFHLLSKIDPPTNPVSVPSLNEVPKMCAVSSEEMLSTEYGIPTLYDLDGVEEGVLVRSMYPGGETEGLRRLAEDLAYNFYKKSYLLDASPTDLGAYLTFGCVSPRTVYFKIKEAYVGVKPKRLPTLYAELISREFFYCVASATENFECRKINWDNDAGKIQAWSEARTGFPFIDAIMTQLTTEGWINYQFRNVVGCFLTRCYLWQSWEIGARIFEEYLLDVDWVLNAGNWMWMSTSAFSCEYKRNYNPIHFGKAIDPWGEYIKKYLPQLKNYPPKYIYQPWEAPIKVQQAAGCILGEDYPLPIIDPVKSLKENMQKMRESLACFSSKKELKMRHILSKYQRVAIDTLYNTSKKIDPKYKWTSPSEASVTMESPSEVSGTGGSPSEANGTGESPSEVCRTRESPSEANGTRESPSEGSGVGESSSEGSNNVCIVKEECDVGMDKFVSEAYVDFCNSISEGN